MCIFFYVGVIAYMAHIGCYVPAERATIGPINRIITRMYTIDSVLNGMSSFANDLNQVFHYCYIISRDWNLYRDQASVTPVY